MRILEPGGFAITVVNARHIEYVPAHKTDKKGSAWVCKLLRAGLLKGSFVPSREQGVTCAILPVIVGSLSSSKLRNTTGLITDFEDANLKLSSVFSNIRGKTCMAVSRRCHCRETDPQKLSELCIHPRLKHSQEEIALAVEGHFTEHHKSMIRAIRKSIKNIESEIDVLDKGIGPQDAAFAGPYRTAL